MRGKYPRSAVWGFPLPLHPCTHAPVFGVHHALCAVSARSLHCGPEHVLVECMGHGARGTGSINGTKWVPQLVHLRSNLDSPAITPSPSPSDMYPFPHPSPPRALHHPIPIANSTGLSTGLATARSWDGFLGKAFLGVGGGSCVSRAPLQGKLRN
jgi:hypothetical protein